MAARISMLEQMRGHRDQREAPAVAQARAMEERWRNQAVREREDARRSARVLAAVSRVLGTAVAKELAGGLAHELRGNLRHMIMKALDRTRDLNATVFIPVLPSDIIMLDDISLAKYVLDQWLRLMPDHCEIAPAPSAPAALGTDVADVTCVHLRFTIDPITVERVLVIPEGRQIPIR